MIIVAKHVVDVIPGAINPDVTAGQFVPAGNGYEYLQMPDGEHYVGVTPAGEFHTDATAPSQYEQCKRSGTLAGVVSWVGAGHLTIREYCTV